MLIDNLTDRILSHPASMAILIGVLICAVYIGTSGVSATLQPPSTISMARGSNITFTDSDAPYFITLSGSQILDNQTLLKATVVSLASANPTIGYAWMFGPHDTKYPLQFTMKHETYQFDLSNAETRSMRSGIYTVYLQMPGPTGIYGIIYNNKTNSLESPFANVKSIPLSGLSPSLQESAFEQAMTIFPSDEVVLNISLDLEPASVTITDNYILGNGDLYLGGRTNLATGDPISATIDPLIYDNSQYFNENYNYNSTKHITNHDYMTANTIVGEGDYHSRPWSISFSQNRSENLRTGLHTISIVLPDGGVTSIPFSRQTTPVTPIPTPEIQSYYAVDGSFYGGKINTTPPQYPQMYTTPTIVVTPTPIPTLFYSTSGSYQTIIPNTVNNRTVPQMGVIYPGEKNLDISSTVGWPNRYSGDYTVQYCEGTNTGAINDTLTISNPYHFDVKESDFSGKMGTWCQYDSWAVGKTLDTEPIAFFVKSLPENTTLQILINGTRVDVTPVPTEVQNVTTVTVTPETTVNMTEIPTATTEEPGTINATPVPWWVAIIAIIGAVAWKRK